MKTIISLLLPTRKRVKLAIRFLESIAKTAAFPEYIEVVIYIDEDDILSYDIDYKGLKIIKIIGQQSTMGTYNSECLAAATGDIIILVNDDVIIRTYAWDEHIRNLDDSISDKIYLAYCNDLFKKKSLSTFPILSKKTCDILQQPFHPAYVGSFIDCHVMDIFKRLEHHGFKRIFYFKDVVFEHLHYRVKKAEFDSVYQARKRFDDDLNFISLVSTRKKSFIFLKNEILGKKSNIEQLSLCKTIDYSLNPIKMFFLFIKTFLFDHTLPIRWRLFLFLWFFVRYIVSVTIKIKNQIL
ncbi:MAG: hypothetical protein KDK90_09350 [Leptospiraceae bacterium]|nr:hypothetical protein [Leptospiraceae bacterium]